MEALSEGGSVRVAAIESVKRDGCRKCGAYVRPGERLCATCAAAMRRAAELIDAHRGKGGELPGGEFLSMIREGRR